MDSFPKNKKGENIYPDYYGGIYINDNDDLVLQIIKKNIPDEASLEYNKYKEILSINKDIIIEYVNNSYNDLENEIAKIAVNIDNTDVISYYIDILNNNIVIEVETSIEKLQNIKNNISNSKLITFKNGEKNVAYLSPGEKITLTNLTDGGCAWGYRARKGTQFGMITAAHCYDLDEFSSPITLNNFGKIVNWKKSGSVDATFIVPNNPSYLYNTLYKTPLGSSELSLSTTVTNNYYIGQFVGQSSYKSGWQTGTLKIVNAAVNVGYPNRPSVNYVQIGVTDVYGQPGDSGGIIFSGTASNPTTMGIVLGGPYTGGHETKFIYASNINKEFGLARY